ncbi:hypothetical protein Pmar_PMAR011757 [Perkinsus marinus ATCC 50983]|uniref:Polyprenol reductase n=1 Tax=Perkinsus marinus (strain ATCC 50983 / TXsc) TaxID=423536 RepID=C5LCM8_PERM5|nr:hypothetical protein Pmar_PMAR011757 [Perkinsus marinus ATCC 50983]EER05711.1 hypothetical protein Pmar_PMAR011757 [Perkinsus marinus ATCC 50983]|eukprot:XP_002773895.1 hypothetical protein Pmar_PMAR011757 [Perkinsus marinus ATCC 50983]
MYKNEQERYGVIITLLLLLIHLYRRVLEQKYLYSKVNDRGLMHISAWILGIGYYNNTNTILHTY